MSDDIIRKPLLNNFELKRIQKYPGEPIKVRYVDDKNQIIVNKKELDKLFLHSEVKNRKIVAFSIVGPLRKGKSFFLCYCLRYLYSKYPSVNSKKGEFLRDDWMGKPDEPLVGFSFKSGVKADTNGILMWSDVFLCDGAGGEKIGIILIDAQGLFEPSKPKAEDQKNFGLCNLISSIQVYNLMNVVQENELEYLEMIVELSKFISNVTLDRKDTKPFQYLLFLIRDFYDEDYKFGFEGGRKYINEEILNTKKLGTNQAAQTVRQNIHSSYEKISAFLMPFPDETVRAKSYDGSWQYLNRNFVTNLKELIENLFTPENLMKKKICNEEITGKEYREYISQYFKAFESVELPEVPRILNAIANGQLNILLGKLTSDFQLEMENLFNIKEAKLENHLNEIFQKVRENSLKKFREMKKIESNEKVIAEYEQKLEDNFKNIKTDFSEQVKIELSKRSQGCCYKFDSKIKCFKSPKSLKINTLIIMLAIFLIFLLFINKTLKSWFIFICIELSIFAFYHVVLYFKSRNLLCNQLPV